MTPTLLCVALAIHFEARGEPIVGQMAVAEVIAERAKTRRLSPCEVVFQPRQFHGPEDNVWDGMPIPKFSEATLRAARHAFNDEPRVCEGAEYFHVGPVPEWGIPVCRYGNHHFWK